MGSERRAREPVCEETKTIRGGLLEFDLESNGMNASVVIAAPKTFTSYASRYRFRREERPASRPRTSLLIPALLIRTSREPYLVLTCLAASAMEVSDVTSMVMGSMASCPVDCWIEAAACAPRSGSRAPRRMR